MTERCHDDSSCAAVQQHCRQSKVVAFKTIRFDGVLNKVVDRFCNHQEFAIVHIIRDAREVMASWKKDQHRNLYKLTPVGKAHVHGRGGPKGEGRHFRGTVKNLTNTCPENVHNYVKNESIRLAKKYTNDMRAIDKMEKTGCAMGYVQIDEKAFSDNPIGTPHVQKLHVCIDTMHTRARMLIMNHCI